MLIDYPYLENLELRNPHHPKDDEQYQFSPGRCMGVSIVDLENESLFPFSNRLSGMRVVYDKLTIRPEPFPNAQYYQLLVNTRDNSFGNTSL